MGDSMRAELLGELRKLPRGELPQDLLFRLAYVQARLHGVDREHEKPAPPEVAREFAVTWVRQRYPGFAPDEMPSDR
jgi:hypothetical protein